MTSPSQRKGDNFERSIIGYLRDEFGAHLSRPKSGAERDLGDIAGIPNWCFELKAHSDMLRSIRLGLADLETEQRNANTLYGGVIVKRIRVTDPTKQLFVCTLGEAVKFIRETGWS